jgi:RecQ family ATP-dependent DNA helicase
LLQNTFRIQSFRDHQKEIINATLSGDDAFVIMRTGGGKSLTYQLPALLEGQASGKVTLVVSPLLSLIRDQEDQMNAFFPNSAFSFTSGLTGGTAEHARRWALVRDPSAGVCLIFVTPEKVHSSGKLKAELQKLHEQGRLGRFVIDECHCACQWGHDFRPDYAKLGILKAHFPTVPILAVTATASDKVREECIHILQMSPKHRFFRSTANRPNLNYSVKLKDDGKDAVLDNMACFIQEKWPTGAGIIYTYSKKDADTVADKLLERGIVAEAYHSECVFEYCVFGCVYWNHS